MCAVMLDTKVGVYTLVYVLAVQSYLEQQLTMCVQQAVAVYLF